ncbi:MAG: cation:proton antiporter [delta proteobacterium ML8_F1]|nr:MAG: cation:proton antiporter [delta proteobacterium ML8_F1]
MKRIFALVLVAVVGILLFSGIYSMEGFPRYGEAEVSERVSMSYIDKNVTRENQEVVFGVSENLETGSANIVTSIIVNYRSFDTLGEVTVLFVSALGVSLLFGSFEGRLRSRYKPNFILRTGSKVVFPLILVMGAYIFIHGHLSPGGGFPGGSMIASAILLMYLADEDFRVRIDDFKKTEGIAGAMYVLLGLVGLMISNYFLSNFLDTGTVGTLFSAGIIPVVYVLVGLKVGSELTGIITDFLKGEVE